MNFLNLQARDGRASKCLGIERARACDFSQSSGIERTRASNHRVRVGIEHQGSSTERASSMQELETSDIQLYFHYISVKIQFSENTILKISTI